MIYGSSISGVDLMRVVASKSQLRNLLVGEMPDHPQQTRICSEKMFSYIGARLCGVLLPLTIDDLAHAFNQRAFRVGSKQRIPVASPDDFDDVPASAAKDGLELLDDVAIAAHGTIQPLQVAIDDENQIVDLLARCKCDSTQSFGFVCFSITEKSPH